MNLLKIFLKLLSIFLFGFQFHITAQEPTPVIIKIREYIKPYVDTKNFNGSILIAKGEKILFNESFGMADANFDIVNEPDTKYHIASVSKNFTGAAILLLEEKGVLRTSDTLSKYLPDFPNANRITIQQLLIHTSGIPNINVMSVYDTVSRFPQSPKSLVSVFKNKSLDFNPGERFSYSNSNYNILALIIENLSGVTYGKFLAENIFNPLGMTNTGDHANANDLIKKLATGYQSDRDFGLEKSIYLDWSSKTGNGSLYTTVGDLYKWDQALYSEKILSKKSIEKMYEDHNAVGYGCFVDDHLGRKRNYMNGRSPGFTSYFGRYLGDKLCIIVLANNYVPVATEIGTNLAAIVLGEKYELRQLTAKLIDKKTAQQLSGRYQFDKSFYRPNFIMSVSEKDGRLLTDWGEMIPTKDLEFIGRGSWSNMSFEVNDKGNVVNMIFDGFKGRKLE